VKLVTRESARFDNNESDEPKSLVSGSKKTSVNATVQLISDNRFQEVKTQNILRILFLCNEVGKIKPLFNPGK